MNTKLLKQRILDLAIQGKLVPQDPNDEPASVLLEKIRNEKEQLVKDGKLKKKDIANDSIIYKGDDNRYYEKFENGNFIDCNEKIYKCPPNWEWTKIKNISESIQYGVNQSAKNLGNYKMVRITDIQNNKVDWNSVPYVDIKDFKKYLLKENDLLFARTGATVGKSFLVSELPYESVYASYLIRLRFFNCSPSYIKCFFESGYYWNQIFQNAKGIGQPNVNSTVLSELFIPIPPIEEQERIVQRINVLFNLVSNIEHNKKELNKLKEIAKSKVLDLAIQGKLVEQDPNDEPVSILLEKIRAEKEQMVREGKLKKKDIANDSIIYKGDDNCYYMKHNSIIELLELNYIPDSWSYSSFNQIWDLISGRDLLPSKYNDNANGIPYITGASNISFGNIEINRWTKFPKVISKKNDLLITCKGTVGKIAFNNIGNIHIARQIMAIRSNRCLLTYLEIYIKHYLVEIKKKSKGIIPGITRDDILGLIIPIPPLNEQKRIVTKVNELLGLITIIEQCLF